MPKFISNNKNNISIYNLIQEVTPDTLRSESSVHVMLIVFFNCEDVVYFTVPNSRLTTCRTQQHFRKPC